MSGYGPRRRGRGAPVGGGQLRGYRAAAARAAVPGPDSQWWNFRGPWRATELADLTRARPPPRGPCGGLQPAGGPGGQLRRPCGPTRLPGALADVVFSTSVRGPGGLLWAPLFSGCRGGGVRVAPDCLPPFGLPPWPTRFSIVGTSLVSFVGTSFWQVVERQRI
jgi:hypothetical protein